MWQNTEEDIRVKLKLKYGFVQAKSAQEFQVLATVVSSIFGGKKKSAVPKNALDAELQLSAMFGKH